jgi:hypothetical protein
MKFPAKTSQDFEIAPAGTHVAICNAVVDLGLQPGRGMYPDPKPEVYIRFELPTEIVKYTKDGQEITGPMSIGRRFTASMSEKANLRKFIEGWFSKKFPDDVAAAGFDCKDLLGRKCLLNIGHSTGKSNGKQYANIVSASPIPKGMPVEYTQHNASLYFSLETPDDAAFNALPAWLQKTVNERVQPAHVTPATDGAPFDDDIPF